MTTGTMTNLQVCRAALRKIGVVATDIEPTADEIKEAAAALGRMLKAWQNKGYNLWAVAGTSIELSAGVEYYPMTPDRPIAINSIRRELDGIETQMQAYTREEYDGISQKLATGVPCVWYYDRQRETGDLYIWPTPSADDGSTLQITYVRELSDVVLTAEADIPSEWYDAVVYGLAARLMDDYDVKNPNIIARAEMELSDALAGDREGSVFFVGDAYR